jgi:integrase
MPRRARNEGNIRKRPDGRYEVRITDPVSGKRRSLFARTEDEAVSRLKAAHRAIDDGSGLADGRVTVEGYFTDWLTGVRPTLRRTTAKRYEQLIRLQIVPHIGKVKLRALTPVHLRKLYATLQTEPRAGRRGKEPLAPRTVGHAHRVIHAALEQAARDGLVGRNVASLVSPPKVPHAEITTLSSAQVRALLTAAQGDNLEALIVLAVTAGLRQGEMLGLKWADIDTDAGTLSVRRSLAPVASGELIFQEPKTARSRRTITLTRAAISALKAHRVRQTEERLRAIGWEHGDMVFPDAIGRPQHPSNVSLDWRALRDRAGLPASFRFHDLRHTAASLALSAGVPITTVSEMLGHANTAITLAIYAHAVPGSQQAAADAMDAVLSAASGT